MTSDDDTSFNAGGRQHRHPEGFKPDTSRPHEAVPVRLGGDMGYRTFCARDGQLWPCPDITDYYMREHRAKHGNTRR